MEAWGRFMFICLLVWFWREGKGRTGWEGWKKVEMCYAHGPPPMMNTTIMYSKHELVNFYKIKIKNEENMKKDILIKEDGGYAREGESVGAGSLGRRQGCKPRGWILEREAAP